VVVKTRILLINVQRYLGEFMTSTIRIQPKKYNGGTLVFLSGSLAAVLETAKLFLFGPLTYVAS
jgi:hypothetical protein